MKLLKRLKIAPVMFEIDGNDGASVIETSLIIARVVSRVFRALYVTWFKATILLLSY